jgi:competence protein ComEA
MTRFDLVTVAAVAIAAVLAAVASLALLLSVVPPAGAPPLPVDPWSSASQPEDVTGGGSLVVDVEGGVNEPGIHHLPAGSRVADALAAAGGYAETVDLVAAAQSLNLAAELVDGQQILVPVIGAGAGADGGGGGGVGLLNLNRATQAELEELPGIGPVTAERIISARGEQPFATLEELVTREVLTARQLEQIAALVTVP